MRTFPLQLTINNELFEYEKILKDDFFSVNVLYKNDNNERYVLKLSDFRFIFGWLLRPIAWLESRHEYKIYKLINGIEGIAELGPGYGSRGYLHKYVEGKTLHELNKDDALPDDFFVKLRAIIDQIHQRRIFYMDLNKLGNIIIGDDGAPYLIDFQVCIHFKKHKGMLSHWLDRIFQRLIREDIYHIYKHKKKFQPYLMTEEELLLSKRSKLGQRYNRYFANPYKKVKRLIYPSGSNEIIWYKWKKMKDQSKRTP